MDEAAWLTPTNIAAAVASAGTPLDDVARLSVGRDRGLFVRRLVGSSRAASSEETTSRRDDCDRFAPGRDRGREGRPLGAETIDHPLDLVSTGRGIVTQPAGIPADVT